MDTEMRLIRIVGMIYEAADDASVWPVALTQIADLLQSTGACVVANDVRVGQNTVLAAARLDPDSVQAYNQDYQAKDLFMEYGRRRLTQGPVSVLASNETIDDSTLLRSEFYQDFLRRYDLFFSLSGVISTEESLTVASLLRSRRQGPFTKDELERLHILMPHIQRACHLQQQLGIAEQSLESLNNLSTGTALMDAAGKVLFMNTAFRQIVAQRDGISLDAKSYITAHSSTSLRHLCRLATATATGNGLSSGGATAVQRPSGKRPFCVRVSPLRPSGFVLGTMKPTALVFVTDPELKIRGAPEVLRLAFGLTAAEAAVALRLLEGRSLDELCDELEIQRTTGRTHLRHIFEKLGVKRQAEAVGVLSRILHE